MEGKALPSLKPWALQRSAVGNFVFVDVLEVEDLGLTDGSAGQ